jgi:hypothetical protein
LVAKKALFHFTTIFQVIVHLRDDTAAEAHMLYYQKHYNLAFYRVAVNQVIQLPSFSDKLHCDQEIFELGRDKHLYLRVGHGRVKYAYDHFFGAHHCMDVRGGNEDFEVHFTLFNDVLLSYFTCNELLIFYFANMVIYKF